MRHRGDGIDITAPLWRRAREVEHEFVRRSLRWEFDQSRFVGTAVIIEPVLRAISSARQLGNAIAHAPLGIIENGVEAFGESAHAIALDQLAKSPFADT